MDICNVLLKAWKFPQVMEQLGTSVVRDAGDWFMILEEIHTHHLPTLSGMGDTPTLLGLSFSLSPI